MKDKMRIFCCGSNPGLSESIAGELDMKLSPLEISRFSNDNLSVQIQENVRDRDVFVIQSLTTPVSEHLMEMLITMDALRSSSAGRITAVIPYYSYARSDKKDAPRISITARLIADLLKTAGADRVLTMDLHSAQVHGFFSMPVDHLTATYTIADYFRHYENKENMIVVATDAGGAKRAGRFAESLDAPIAIIDKRRISDTEVNQGELIGNVRGRDAVIFDDEIATGATILETIKTLKAAGVGKIYVSAVHPVLCGEAVSRLKKAGIEKLIVTNTVEITEEKLMKNMMVLSVAPLMAEAIRRIHTGESVGELFPH
ncbi:MULTISPECIES: ribose-phosphate pyrophosphokinase [unclassified Oceanispirochaeta]|uniref:ribose-phosphate diphosphokinase n=1 Tax=unclassified Oceanispirochaeta TaxID=2635722 RepID=UPI000E091BCD|nr:MULTISPECIES: ribose-phosphate pyrophosphokinase [unclassified Oceanispirochaeta]MBF9014100.1 ribose-phosphate pyrophosphokinase [Oceanispirochaeta sp. M2]NPD70591.1 ribose-phosphate pyrophosphokinase [Oceanispirochaeta sp. M1]RDG34356.1 ribose-phosphate pyrophosphokinase [Oceanispirochaeta sp. M1]